ncbi:MAG: FtsX-like permease family protein [Brachymonas denitrificans]|jgi:ABC-type lipoprotein release transport system permease subunit|uniref:ABC transporter permease n=1 Tax=Brachymonas denitrificans TaxID=28220 RepID=UPI00352E71AA
MTAWLARQRYLIDYVLAAMARQKGRAIGLWVVYTLLVFVLASVMLFTHALRQESARVLQHAPEVVVQKLVAGRTDLIPPDYLEKMGRIRGVREKQLRLWGYYYDSVVKANYTFMVPPVAAPEPGTIIVGPAMARTRGIKAGDPIAFRNYAGTIISYQVAQVLPQPTELMSADLVLLSEQDFRSLFNFPEGYYTDIALTVANPREVRNVATKVTEALPDARPILREEILRTYASVFDWREGMVLAVLSGALLAFAILAWDKASGLSAQERREIGILKAVGWETGDVLRMKLWEGLLVSFTAFLAGYLLAYWHVFHAGGALFRPVLQGWAVLYPEFALRPEVDGLQLFTLLFFTVVPFTAAVLVPSWRAAITDPDAVMRA